MRADLLTSCGVAEFKTGNKELKYLIFTLAAVFPLMNF